MLLDCCHARSQGLKLSALCIPYIVSFCFFSKKKALKKDPLIYGSLLYF